MSKQSTLARARAFLRRVPLIDSHNDLPYVIRKESAADGDLVKYDLNKAHQNTDTDIPRMKAGMQAGQFWAAFCPTNIHDPTRFTLELIAMIRQMNMLHANVFLHATKASDLAKAKRLGKIASFIAVENGIGIGDRVDMLDVFHALDVRYMTLCHNETLDWVDSATDAPRHNGLTDFGRSVIQRMNKLGLLVDMSHTTPAAMHHVLDVTVAPVAITHANARSLCDHPRNVADDVLVRLKANGGIVMATFVPTFINQEVRDWFRPMQTWGKAPLDGSLPQRMTQKVRMAGPPPKATLAQYCDHVEYMADKAGIDHIGIGSDFYGGPVPEGLEDVSKFPDLIAALMDRGWSDKNLAKLSGRNFIRVMRDVENAAKKAAS
jgi:membrane dipeptidase